MDGRCDFRRSCLVLIMFLAVTSHLCNGFFLDSFYDYGSTPDNSFYDGNEENFQDGPRFYFDEEDVYPTESDSDPSYFNPQDFDLMIQNLNKRFNDHLPSFDSDEFYETLEESIDNTLKDIDYLFTNDETEMKDEKPAGEEVIPDEDHELSFEDLGKAVELASSLYNININDLLGDSDIQQSWDQVDREPEGDIPILHRRKRSPSPRRGGSSSRGSSGSWGRSSSRRTSSGSSSSSSSSRRTSDSGSSWFRLGSRRTSTSSRGSSSSSRGSSTRRVATGTAVGGTAAGGTAIGTSSSGSSKPYPVQPSPTYPTSGTGTAPAPYPTSGVRPTGTGTAPAPYPTSGTGTAPAPYPTSGVRPTGTGTAPAPYPTSGTGTAPAPYPTSGVRPTGTGTAPAPYPTSGTGTAPAPYPTSGGRPFPGSPYPTGGSPYPTSTNYKPNYGSPYGASGLPYPSAGSPYSTGHHPSYPRHDQRHYPNTGFPSTAYASGGAGGYRPHGSGFGGPGIPTHSNFPKPKKSKSKKVKEAVKMAIKAYAIRKAAKKAKKGMFSPSIFSSRKHHYGSSFGHHGYGYGGGYGMHGGGGYGSSFGNHLGGAAMAHAGGKVAKKILGAYVKMKIAKYALKFGVEAAKVYFRYKLGYDLRDQAIMKFMDRYEKKQMRRQSIFREKLGLSNDTVLNITIGEECARTCVEDDERNCFFTFKVHLYQTLTRACFNCPQNLTDCLRPECVTGSGSRRLLKVVNRQLPGPAIQVCRGDRVLVEVQNELPSSGVTFHWHGLTMNSDPFMDGVSGLTQCPILPRETFTYSFKANFPGTHYWHAQEGLLRGEGLYGPLIVRKPDESELQRYFYDYDLSQHVLLMSELPSRTSEGQFAERFFNEDVPPATNLLINGRGGQKEGDELKLPYARIEVVKDKRYRLRLINAASLNCPMRVVAPEKHNFTVIAADGASVAPFYTQSIVVNNGERWDVVLTADQTPGLYWISMIGEVECAGLNQGTIVSYKTSLDDPLLPANETAAPPIPSASLTNETLAKEQILDFLEDTDVPSGLPLVEDKSALRANTHGENCSHPNITCLEEIRSTPFSPLPDYMSEPWVEDTLFLAFGSQPLYNRHFYSLLYYGPEFMPPKKRSKTPQVNNLSLRLPAKPLLLDQSPLKKDVCSASGVRRKHCVGDYCECLHNHEIDVGQVVELVLVNEGMKNETVPQPVHLHGYRFWVMSQGIYDPKIMNSTTEENSTTEDNPTTEENSTTEDNSTSSVDETSTDSSNSTKAEDEAELPQPSDDFGFTRLHALNLFTKDKLYRNFYHPIMKDTIVIPSAGYAIIRFRADNKGFWLGESQVLLQSVAGQGFVLQVGNSTQLPSPPKAFPKC